MSKVTNSTSIGFPPLNESRNATRCRMVATNTKLTAAVEAYFAHLRRVRASGGATSERSSCGPLANLLGIVTFAKTIEDEAARKRPRSQNGGHYNRLQIV